MSQAPTAATDARVNGNATVVDDGETVQELLDALDDDDCRCILDATSDEALTASELSETCDLPLSTAYRKLELLSEAGLVEERTRVRRSGKHASEYVRAVEDVVISVASGAGLQLRLVDRSEPERAVSPGSVEW